MKKINVIKKINIFLHFETFHETHPPLHQIKYKVIDFVPIMKHK